MRHHGAIDRPKPIPPKSKRRAERSQPLHDLRANEKSYVCEDKNYSIDKGIKPIACANCHSRQDLFMVGHPPPFEERVGWIFICEGCFELIKANKLRIGITIKPGEEDGR